MTKRVPDPDAVLADLREAIAPEVDAEVADRLRRFKVQTYVLYAICLGLLVGVSWLAVSNLNSITKLCQVAKNQRSTLELQKTNIDSYLKSEAGQEKNPLNDYIKQISIPQLQQRLAREQIPRFCKQSKLKG